MTDKYHVFVGSETGLLKGLNVEQGKWDNLNALSTVNRSNEICVMCWENRRQEDSILFGTRGGLVKTYSPSSGASQDILQVTDSDEQVMKGLYKLDGNYVTCTNTGRLCVWKERMNNSTDDTAGPLTIDCGNNVCCMKEDPANPARVSTGGQENCLKIFDLNKPEAGPIFKAKNVRNDFLELRVPIWVTDIGYMPRASSSLVVTSTGDHQIRVYDQSASQRRPVVDMEWEEYPITSLCVSPHEERQLVVANTVGEQALIDIRNKKCLGKFKGGAGAIRCVQCHPTLPLVVSCGLDRYVRVHHMGKRLLTQKFYMKSRVNKLLLTANWDTEEAESDEEISAQVKDEQEDDVEESDALWGALDAVGDESTVTKVSKRSQPNGTVPEPTKRVNKKRKG